jgi:hypothetical protein
MISSVRLRETTAVMATSRRGGNPTFAWATVCKWFVNHLSTLRSAEVSWKSNGHQLNTAEEVNGGDGTDRSLRLPSLQILHARLPVASGCARPELSIHRP